MAVAGLALIKRYESFLIAVLRAHQEFALTTELDVLEALVSAVAVSAGLWLAGFWGLLAAVGVILVVEDRLSARPPPARGSAGPGTRRSAARLMRIGLPILANTAVFGTVLSLDRVLILWRVPQGARAAGLYTIAIMGTSWGLDLAGRIVTVLYTYFQTTLGRTRDPLAVARQAVRATEAQAPLLAAGSAVAYLVGPAFLGALMPRYAEGLPALRPLLPGTVLLGLAWPARQMLITIERPYRLCLATLAGLAVLAVAGTLGADRAGIVGVAWGTSLGYAAVSALTSAHRLRPHARVAGLAGPSGPTGADPVLVRGGDDPRRARPRSRSRPAASSWPPGSSPRSGSGAVGTPGEGSWIGRWATRPRTSIPMRHGCSTLDSWGS